MPPTRRRDFNGATGDEVFGATLRQLCRETIRNDTLKLERVIKDQEQSAPQANGEQVLAPRKNQLLMESHSLDSLRQQNQPSKRSGRGRRQRPQKN